MRSILFQFVRRIAFLLFARERKEGKREKLLKNWNQIHWSLWLSPRASLSILCFCRLILLKSVSASYKSGPAHRVMPPGFHILIHPSSPPASSSPFEAEMASPRTARERRWIYQIERLGFACCNLCGKLSFGGKKGKEFRMFKCGEERVLDISEYFLHKSNYNFKF